MIYKYYINHVKIPVSSYILNNIYKDYVNHVKAMFVAYLLNYFYNDFVNYAKTHVSSKRTELLF